MSTGTVLFDNLLVPMSAKRKRRYSKCQDGPGVSYSGYFNQKLSLGTVPLSHFWDALTVHDCTITVTIRTVPVDTEWESFFAEFQNPDPETILSFGRLLAAKYGFTIYF